MDRNFSAISSGELAMLTEGSDIGLQRLPNDTKWLDGASARHLSEYLSHLRKGGIICVRDCYNSALRLRAMIRSNLISKRPSSSYLKERNQVSSFHDLAARIYIPTSRLRGMPRVPWVEAISKNKSFQYVSLSSFLGLNSAWERFQQGVLYPHLPFTIHPFHNIYCPPRHASYVKLFDTWLNEQSEKPKAAVDLGTGCGVLAFTLLHRGVEYVHASDINPRCAMSVDADYRHLQTKPPGNLTVGCGDLFASVPDGKHFDLVVFNPPWLPAPSRNLSYLDCAVFAPADLLRRFLDGARRFNASKIVILFSDLAEVAIEGAENQVKRAIEDHGGFEVVKVVEAENNKKRNKQNKKLQLRSSVQLWEIRIHQKSKKKREAAATAGNLLPQVPRKKVASNKAMRKSRIRVSSVAGAGIGA